LTFPTSKYLIPVSYAIIIDRLIDFFFLLVHIALLRRGVVRPAKQRYTVASPTESLRDILKREDCFVPGIPIFYVFAKGKFYSDWLNEEG
jgi:hypothetical protein